MYGATTFPIIEFLTVFKHIREQAFKPETIKSSFRETGIVPLNANKIIEPLRKKAREREILFRRVVNPARPLITPSPLSSNLAIIEPRSEYITPRKIADINAFRTHIHGLLVQQNVNPTIILAFEKLKKDALIRLHAGAHAEFHLHNTEAAQKARNAQSKQGKKVVAHARGNPIYIKKARTIMRTREKLEIEKNNKFLIKQ
jgi:hypothetical protein